MLYKPETPSGGPVIQRDDLFWSGIPKFAVAIGATEAADVKHLLVGQETLHRVDCLLTFDTGLSHRGLKLLGKGKRKGQLQQRQ